MFSRWARPIVRSMAYISDAPIAEPRPAPPSGANGIVPGVGRAGALAGLAGVVVYVIGAFLPGNAPKPDVTTSQIVAFFVSHRSALLTEFALQLVALVLLLCFLGQLRTVIAAGGGIGVPLATTMTAGWVVLITMVSVASLPAMAIVWYGGTTTSPDIVRLAYDMETLGTYAMSATAAMVSVAAPSIVIWRQRILPRSLAVLGAAEVAANVVEFLGLAARHGALAGGNFYGIGLILWLLWVATVSVIMGCSYSRE